MITRRPGKLTIKEIETLSLSATNLQNLAYSFVFRDTADLMKSYIISSPSIYGAEPIKRLPRPNVTMKGYESSPGCWVFDDTESKITWIMFSDCYRKSHFKGTSYELILPEDIIDEQLKVAIQKFLKYLGVGK